MWRMLVIWWVLIVIVLFLVMNDLVFFSFDFRDIMMNLFFLINVLCVVSLDFSVFILVWKFEFFMVVLVVFVFEVMRFFFMVVSVFSFELSIVFRVVIWFLNIFILLFLLFKFFCSWDIVFVVFLVFIVLDFFRRLILYLRFLMSFFFWVICFWRVFIRVCNWFILKRVSFVDWIFCWLELIFVESFVNCVWDCLSVDFKDDKVVFFLFIVVRSLDMVVLDILSFILVFLRFV